MKTNFGSTSVRGSEGEKERICFARKGLLVFFAMLIPLSVLGYVLTMKYPIFVLFLMWTPGLSSIFTRLLLREGIADISLRVGGRRTWRTLPFILLFPVVIDLVAYGTAWITGLVQFVTPDTYIKAPPVVIFLGLLLTQMVIGTITGLIGSVGEELGWRGYMLPRLIDARVPYPMLTSGIIWGLWHLPLMIAGNYYSGPYLALSAFLFMISVTSFGYIIGCLRLTTGSVWPAFFLHAYWNAVIQDVFDSFSKGENVLLWTGESGILVALALLAAAWFISRRPMSMRRL
ncbi:CPBP family intramembrane metalloprotease [Paenibacillus chitinolyticus]|uniref:CPBP family intramembrane metalloprotease n=1 Tax=Paenibacillus chitinolyticus TaxID=79263 RepID=A0A410X2V0_9BACL|nr:type II CAAX endopeptidase family protein [Paenibacillus chitinolyticus]MCY9593809.1 CPBP family intramembrane metalloprotease [Paenibacillus chitinolyticus]MCY9599314.1 CPBP family intramembrane metalloprotease [Paenibacillus chitinolyticus]QAV20927.1 CPBP family intramembrane metalloprotease [Paenibacillus chitinolyticus]